MLPPLSSGPQTAQLDIRTGPLACPSDLSHFPKVARMRLFKCKADSFVHFVNKYFLRTRTEDTAVNNGKSLQASANAVLGESDKHMHTQILTSVRGAGGRTRA